MTEDSWLTPDEVERLEAELPRRHKVIFGAHMAYLAEHFGLDPNMVRKMTLIAEVGEPVILEVVCYATVAGGTLLPPRRFELVEIEDVPGGVVNDRS